MMAKRSRRTAAEPSEVSSITEKHVDATDEEQSSDDEAPEEVSAAAASALAGRRRKAEQQARQAAAAPKRKRARSSSSKGAKNTSAADADAGANVVAGRGGGESGLVGGDELELPSDLLLKVKSGGLQRMEADVLAARELEEQGQAASATALSAGSKVKKRAGDLSRSDNFQLVVLDEDDGGVGDGAGSKPAATENARNFLRDRLGSRKRVSYSLLKARKRLGPSPNF